MQYFGNMFDLIMLLVLRGKTFRGLWELQYCIYSKAKRFYTCFPFIFFVTTRSVENSIVLWLCFMWDTLIERFFSRKRILIYG